MAAEELKPIYDIYIYFNSETDKVETILSYGIFGDSEYDPTAKRWVAIGEEDTWRVRDLGLKCDIYKVDFDNEADFDFEGDNLTLKKFSDETLNEEYLQKNTILVNEPLAK